jgi:hypothetical protein
LVQNLSSAMTQLDERVDLERMRDLRGRRAHPWIRRALLMLLGAPVLLASTGAIGQRTASLTAATPNARLRVEAPGVLRGGLMWRARITVRATAAISHPRLILGRGYVEGMQLNTIEPSPASEANRGAQLVLSYDALDAGDELVVYLQLQVNPTTVGRQDTSVAIDDEATRLARIAHVTRVLP